MFDCHSPSACGEYVLERLVCDCLVTLFRDIGFQLVWARILGSGLCQLVLDRLSVPGKS